MSESEFQTSVPELHEGNIYKIMRKPIVSGRFFTQILETWNIYEHLSETRLKFR